MPDADSAPGTHGSSAQVPSVQRTPLLRSLRIGNLKALEGVHSVELAPLTLIFGPNAAGKTTILQSLELLRDHVLGPETFKSAEWVWSPWADDPASVEDMVVHYRPKIGPLVSRHDFRLTIDIGVDFELASPTDGVGRATLRLGMRPFVYPSGLEQHRPIAVLQLARAGEDARTFTGEDGDQAGVTAGFERLKGLLAHTVFLEPYRLGREGPYPYRGSAEEPLGRASRKEWAQRQAERDTAVNAWLRQLGVEYRVLPLTAEGITADEARELNREEVFEDWADTPHPTGTGMFFLEDLRSEVTVTLNQVGHGVSQLLPIVDVCMAGPDQVICIEQPELHLHPRLQSNLGDLLVDSVLRGNQVIVETHSENILLRVRRRIRQRRLKPDEVAVIYVDNTKEDGVTVRRLRLGEQGELLDPWPRGFFDDSLEDVLGGWE